MSASTLDRPVAAAERGTGYLHGLDLLRVFASSSVVVTHLVAWFSFARQPFWVAQGVESGVVGPLRLNPRLSFLGVALFLVVSGVVVTHVAGRERPAQFLRRRVVRLAPLLWVVTLLAWVMINLGLRVSATPQEDLGVGDLLGGLVLANFFWTPQVPLSEVAWTLPVQLGFYCYVAATIPVLRRMPWLPPLAAVPLCFTILLVTGGPDPLVGFNLGQFGVYLPLLCVGQLISLVHSGKVGPYAGTAIGVAHYALFVWADKAGEYTFQGESVVRTVLLAVLATIVLVTVSGPVSRSRVVRSWAKRTYAVYLVHQIALYPLFDALMPHLDPTLVVLLGLAAVF
ncbi:acyltransferase family protein, partial [Saccharothrix sp. MB29]|nr:acyltransferase family protein [Saccharothrix sp. MB29]